MRTKTGIYQRSLWFYLLLFITFHFLAKNTQATEVEEVKPAESGTVKIVDSDQIVANTLGLDPLLIEFDLEESQVEQDKTSKEIKSGASVHVGIGEKENVLENQETNLNSSFLFLSLEAYVAKSNNSEVLQWYGLFESSRFYDTELSGDKRFLYSQLHRIKPLSKTMAAGFELSYYFQQYYSPSEGDSEETVDILHNQELSFSPFLSFQTDNGLSFKLEATLARNLMEESDEDYSELAGSFSLKQSYRFGSYISVEVENSQNQYAEWEQRTTTGANIAESTLATEKRGLFFTSLHRWDKKRSLSFKTSVSTTTKTDNSSGYYDYTLNKASENIIYRSKNWELKGAAGVTLYQYKERLSSTSTDEKKLSLRTFYGNGGIEYIWGQGWSAKATTGFEQCASNDQNENYQAKTAEIGLTKSF